MKQINTKFGRLYEVRPGVYYPSVTTMIKYNSDETWLEEWRKREPNHKQIVLEASTIGTDLHYLCELYCTNTVAPSTFIPHIEAQELWPNMKIAIDDITNDFIFSEHRMCSDKLRVAGTCDLVACKDDRLIIIDFKNSRKRKSPSSIKNYYIQIAMYAQMVEEMYNYKVDTGYILIACRDTKTTQTIEVDINEWKSYAKIYSNNLWKQFETNPELQNLFKTGAAQ